MSMPDAIGPLLKSIHERMKASADADLKAQGLTFAQSQVIVFLRDVGGQALQKQVEEHLDVSHPTVTGIVGRMEKNGFVRTWTDERDHRNKIVKLTDKSEEVGVAMERTMRAREERLLEGLDQRDRSELRRLLRQVYKNLQ